MEFLLNILKRSDRISVTKIPKACQCQGLCVILLLCKLLNSVTESCFACKIGCFHCHCLSIHKEIQS